MGYAIRRVDANQREIVATFRKLGCLVQVLSSIGHGCPDILVAIFRPNKKLFMRLIEIKDGFKSASAQSLTADEQKFHEKWREAVMIIKNVDEVIELVKNVLEGKID